MCVSCTLQSTATIAARARGEAREMQRTAAIIVFLALGSAVVLGALIGRLAGGGTTVVEAPDGAPISVATVSPTASPQPSPVDTTGPSGSPAAVVSATPL